MTTTTTSSALALLWAASLLTAPAATAQLMSTCAENSPERRGELGCTIVATKALPDGRREPLVWHLDRFESLDRARAAAGRTGIAFEAAGTFWRSTIEPETVDHHGGIHVAQTGALTLPRAAKYAMVIRSSTMRRSRRRRACRRGRGRRWRRAADSPGELRTAG
jgi:hypothetical protein